MPLTMAYHLDYKEVFLFDLNWERNGLQVQIGDPPMFRINGDGILIYQEMRGLAQKLTRVPVNMPKVRDWYLDGMMASFGNFGGVGIDGDLDCLAMAARARASPATRVLPGQEAARLLGGVFALPISSLPTMVHTVGGKQKVVEKFYVGDQAWSITSDAEKGMKALANLCKVSNKNVESCDRIEKYEWKEQGVTVAVTIYSGFYPGADATEQGLEGVVLMPPLRMAHEYGRIIDMLAERRDAPVPDEVELEEEAAEDSGSSSDYDFSEFADETIPKLVPVLRDEVDNRPKMGNDIAKKIQPAAGKFETGGGVHGFSYVPQQKNRDWGQGNGRDNGRRGSHASDRRSNDRGNDERRGGRNGNFEPKRQEQFRRQEQPRKVDQRKLHDTPPRDTVRKVNPEATGSRPAWADHDDDEEDGTPLERTLVARNNIADGVFSHGEWESLKSQGYLTIAAVGSQSKIVKGVVAQIGQYCAQSIWLENFNRLVTDMAGRISDADFAALLVRLRSYKFVVKKDGVKVSSC